MTLLEQVETIMQDGYWRTFDEIIERIRKDYNVAYQGSTASVSARLRDLRKLGYTVDRRARGVRSNGLYEYRMSGQRVQQPSGPQPSAPKEPARTDTVLIISLGDIHGNGIDYDKLRITGHHRDAEVFLTPAAGLTRLSLDIDHRTRTVDMSFQIDHPHSDRLQFPNVF